MLPPYLRAAHAPLTVMILQAVVAQLAAAGVDPAMLQGLAMQPAPLISDPSGSYTTNTNSVALASGMCLGPASQPCCMASACFSSVFPCLMLCRIHSHAGIRVYICHVSQL